MRDHDYSEAVAFLAAFFAGTTHAVELRALPQEQGAGPARPRFTREPEIVIDHLTKWDGEGRACYVGMTTRITGHSTGSRADLAELPALWTDVDCYKLGITKEHALERVQSIALPPSLIVDSGGGLHCYWLLREPVDVRIDAGGTVESLRVETEVREVLQRLRTIVCGDDVCDLPRIMRLPGTHNTKTDTLRLCSVISGDLADLRRYDLAELVEMLDTQRPVIVPDPAIFAPTVEDAAEDNPYLRAAHELGFKPGMDIEAEFATMTYKHPKYPISKTRYRAADSLVAKGMADSDILARLMQETEAAFVRGGYQWDAQRERQQKTIILSEIKRAHVYIARMGAQKTVRAVAGGAPVVSIADERAKRQQTEPADEEDGTIWDIEKINQTVKIFNEVHKYKVVNEEGRAMVYQSLRDKRLKRDRIIRISFEDLKKLYLNLKIKVGIDKKGKAIVKTGADIWLSHPDRTQYLGGVVFDPTGETDSSQLNLWQGYAIAPVPGVWGKLRQHIFKVLCCGDEDHFDFLMGWMARLVQSPAEQGEVAVVMRGEEGTGKGTLARVLMRILGQHGLSISNAKHLTGQYNGHLRDTVFLFADEAFWAGDKQHVGVLKALISEPYLTVEGKYQVVIQTPNYVHLMMASNNEWVVPASLEARRFFVLNVSNEHRNDHAYFKEIWEELDQGGFAAMLHDLLKRDLAEYNPRAVPNTVGLGEQRLLSLPLPEEWWLSVLHRGYVYQSKIGLETDFAVWHETVTTELLYASFLAHAGLRRSYQTLSRVHFGRFLRKMGVVPTRPIGEMIFGEHITDVPSSFGPGKTREARVILMPHKPAYRLGALDDARESFCSLCRVEIDWEENFGLDLPKTE